MDNTCKPTFYQLFVHVLVSFLGLGPAVSWSDKEALEV
jgi:hypothetical protein